MKTLILILVLIATTSAQGWAAGNPDAGKKMRTICYRSEDGGDEASANKDFMVIIEQAEGSHYDASYFIPGNTHYRMTHVTKRDGFNVYVYPTVKKTMGVDISGVKSKELADRLLKIETGWHYENVLGRRAKNKLHILIPDGYIGIERKYTQLTEFSETNQETHGGSHWFGLYCEDSYSIDVQKP